MLIELFGRNFQCFRDEFRLSLLATDIDPQSSRGVIDVPLEGEAEPVRLLRSVAIIGPNASGKSTVLSAAFALRFLLENSAKFESDQPIPPYTPFALDATHKGAPVMLGLRGVIAGRVYEYEIEFDRSRVHRELLVHLSQSGQEVQFRRIGQNVEGRWRSDPQFGLLTASFRANALLLPLADVLAPSLAGDIAVGLRKLLGYYDATEPRRSFDPWDSAATRAAEDDSFGEWLRNRIKDADVGVSDFQTQRIQEPPTLFSSRSPDAGGESAKRKSFRLALLHDGANGPTALPYFRESLGTRRFIEASPMFYDLAQGADTKTYFADELGASLHPLLLEGLLRHFNCDLAATHIRGQLIFATHEISLLDDEARHAVLRRDQVYLTEKDSTGAARLFSLAEFSERNNLNLRRRYLQGRYGALPSLGDFSEP